MKRFDARSVATAVGLFALAVLIRALPFGEVFTENGIRLIGTDPYFHMRAIAWSVEHFPAVQTFDPYIQYPDGARPIVGPLFDWLIALVALPFVGDVSGEGLARLEAIAVWVPPVLGGLAVVSTWSLGRRHFGAAAALISGLLLAILSGHFWFSRIGLVDHHVAVSLLSVLQLGFALRLVSPSDDAFARLRFGPSAALGVSIAAAFLVWPGSLLHLALIDGPLITNAVFQHEARHARSRAIELAIVHGLAAMIVAPFAWGNEWAHLSAFTPVVLSEFQPWLLASIAIGMTLTSVVWSRAGFGTVPIRRLGTILGMGGLVFAASVLIFPNLLEGLDLIRQWLSRSEQFAAYRAVAEATPLLIADGEFDPEMGLRRLSWFLFAYPVVVIVLALAVRRDADRAVIASLLFWATGLFVATLLQRRFFNSFSIGLALVTALAFVRAYASFGIGWLSNIPKRTGGAALFAVALLAVSPLFDAYVPYFEAYAARRDGRPVPRSGLEEVVRIHQSIADWLREETPSPGDWLVDTPRPTYGVLAPSDFGHALKYIARRPVVVDNFLDDVGGDGGNFLEEVFSVAEAEAIPMLGERGVRFVVAPINRGQLGRDVARGGLLDQLATLGRPRAARVAGIESAPAQLRLRFEHAWVSPGGSRIRPLFRIFEVVPGASLFGRSAPGSRVTASLDLRLPHGLTIRVDHSTRADEKGAWSLRVPHSTLGAPGSITSAPSYAIQCGERSSSIAVEEMHVLLGERVFVECEGRAGAGPSGS